MSQIALGTIHKFLTGETVTGDDTQIATNINIAFELLRLAGNDTDTKVSNLTTNTYTKAEVDANTYNRTQLNAGQLDSRYYTEAELNAGQLDNRYFTETEVNAALLLKADAASVYTKTELNAGQLDTRYYTETELNAGQLDNRYFTETELLTGGQLDARYYTETELNAGQLNNLYYTQNQLSTGQLDTRYYTEAEIDTQLAEIQAGQIVANSITNAQLATDIKVGSLSLLTTTNKASVTGAINEVKSSADAAASAAATYTAADVLTKIKTVDGTGSGLDADTVRGKAVLPLDGSSDMTGALSILANKAITVNNWGGMSSCSNGDVLFGNNCYLDSATSQLKYKNTHANLGARGIIIRWSTDGQAYYFNMGNIASTADAVFTPTFQRMWHAGNDGAGSGLDAHYLGGIDSLGFSRTGPKYTPALLQDTQIRSGIYTNDGQGLLNSNGTPFKTGWYHIYHSYHGTDGYAVQVAYPFDVGNASDQTVYWRNSQAFTWGAWQAMGGSQVMIASSEVQHALTGAEAVYNSPPVSNYVLIGKFIPKSTGELLVEAEIMPFISGSSGSSVMAFGYFSPTETSNSTAFQKDPAGGVTGGGDGLDWRTPIGTNSMPGMAAGWSQTITLNAYVSVSFKMVIKNKQPIYLGALSGSNLHSIKIRNLNVKYSLTQ